MRKGARVECVRQQQNIFNEKFLSQALIASVLPTRQIATPVISVTDFCIVMPNYK